MALNVNFYDATDSKILTTPIFPKSIQIELGRLKESHPDLADYLMNNSSPSNRSGHHDTTELIFNSIDKVTVHQQQQPPSTPSAQFIYYNNETHSFEGVSMQSTYSVISLGKNKSLTLMTTSTTLSAPLEPSKPKIVEKISKSILPLYPQFVYSIRVVSLGDEPGDWAQSLNEQTQESSKIRFNFDRFSHLNQQNS